MKPKNEKSIGVSNNNNITCLKERLGSLLSRRQKKWTMHRIESQVLYKHTRTEGRKLWHDDGQKNISNCEETLLLNRQYSSTFVSEQDKGARNKILSKLTKEIWD